MAETKIKIIVLCTGNSCRSQMAEGIIRDRLGARVDICSAGTAPAAKVHPYAVKTLKDFGINISNARTKDLEKFLQEKFDIVITTCDHAKESCPVFPGAPRQLHWSMEDPASVRGSIAEIKEVFLYTAEQIQRRVKDLAENLDKYSGK